MDVMKMHLLALQLSDLDHDATKVESLKEELNKKYAELRGVLNIIFHEDEQAEHIVKKIRQLI